MEEIKAIEDLEEELCEYCPLEDYQKGVHCYGGEPVMCEGSRCDEAYENYVDDMEDRMKEEFGELTSKDFMHMSTEDIEKITKNTRFGCSLPYVCPTCAFGSHKGNCWCLSNSGKAPNPTYRQEQCLKELIKRSEKTDYMTDIDIKIEKGHYSDLLYERFKNLSQKKQKEKEKKKYKPEDYSSIDWKSRSKAKRKVSLITEW